MLTLVAWKGSTFAYKPFTLVGVVVVTTVIVAV